ncbi:MAG: hypothetical protein M0023_16130 [Desulfobacteraceae bacterium]|nr:hypothetical protein [Desulfobacteraceae bacterium]
MELFKWSKAYSVNNEELDTSSYYGRGQEVLGLGMKRIYALPENEVSL